MPSLPARWISSPPSVHFPSSPTPTRMSCNRRIVQEYLFPLSVSSSCCCWLADRALRLLFGVVLFILLRRRVSLSLISFTFFSRRSRALHLLQPISARWSWLAVGLLDIHHHAQHSTTNTNVGSSGRCWLADWHHRDICSIQKPNIYLFIQHAINYVI